MARLREPAISHWQLACLAGGRAQKGLEEASMERVTIEEELRMPLNAEEETMGG